MPKTFGEPGKYPDTKARKITLSAFAVSLGAMNLMSIAFGYLSAAKAPPLGKGLAFLVWVAASWGVIKFMDRVTTKATDERRNYLKGADGEHLVGYLLEDLPASYHLFHGLQLEAGSDIDHVAVGPGGIFLLSTKNWRGLLTVSTDGKLLHNGKLPDGGDVLQKTRRAAMMLRERLMALVGEDVYVQGVLVVPLAWTDVPSLVRNIAILRQDNLASWIEGAPRRLDSGKVTHLATAMHALATTALSMRENKAKVVGGQVGSTSRP